MSGDDDVLLQQNDMLIPQDIVAQTCLNPLEIRAPEAGAKPADRPWRRVSACSQRGHWLSPSGKPSRPPSPAQPRHQRFSRHATGSAAVETTLISPLEGVRKQVQRPRHSCPLLRNLGGPRFQPVPCKRANTAERSRSLKFALAPAPTTRFKMNASSKLPLLSVHRSGVTMVWCHRPHAFSFSGPGSPGCGPRSVRHGDWTS